MINTNSKTAFSIILSNLIIGNAILFFGGKISFTGNANYPLMAGISVSCILFYSLFFKYSDFKNFSNFKLVLVSVLSGMCIVFFGILSGLLITEPTSEFFLNIPAVILMGLMGIIFTSPVSLFLGLINFGIIKYLKKK